MNVQKNSNGNKLDEGKLNGNASFNLIDEPWIPVVNQAGKMESVGLKELFNRAKELSDLGVGTLERIAITRLLLCIAQRAIGGPRDEDEWENVRDSIIQKTLEYLEYFYDLFDLFGQSPFLQVKNLEASKGRTDKLDFGLASGNNTTLFDQFATDKKRTHSYDWLARRLLVFQFFSPGGRIGVATWENQETPGKGSSESSPGIEGCMLHTFLKGRNLLETIHWNMVPFKNTKGQQQIKWGKPVWESKLSAFNKNEKEQEEITQGYFGRLVPLSRTILLDELGKEMILANGFSYNKLPDYREPAATVIIKEKKKEAQYVRTDVNNHPWRQLYAILTMGAQSQRGGPLVLSHLDTIFNSSFDTVELWCGGIQADKAKIIDTASWSFTIRAEMQNDSALRLYEKGVRLANNAANRLTNAIKKYLDVLMLEPQKDVKNAVSSLVVQAKTLFWTALDQQYEVLIEEAENHNDFSDPLENWKKLLIVEMKSAYEKICPHETARQLQAYAMGERSLHFGEKKDKTKMKKNATDKKTTRKKSANP